MQAVVFIGVGDIRLEDVPEPRIEQPTDAIVRITATAICGTELHFVRGIVPGMKPRGERQDAVAGRERRVRERAVDRALEDTFPASDAVAKY